MIPRPIWVFYRCGMSAHVSTTTATRAVIYCRVSSDTKKGRSVEEQEHECRQHCERQGWPVADVLIDNDRSASRFATKTRPEYERLREILRPGDILVTWEASRAGRSLDTYVELRRLCAERGVLLSYSGKLYDLNDGDDRFSTGMDALLAEKDAEQIRARIMRAHRANLAAGKPHGKPVYGYRIVRDPETGKTIGRVPHPAQAPLVAAAVASLLEGQSLASVVRWLETQDPAGWNPAKIRRIVTNPAIAGYRTHSDNNNGKRGPQVIHGPGTWEPIITAEQLADITALFAARKSGPRGMPVKHLLTGIAVCAQCRKPLRRNLGAQDRVNGGRYVVLACPDGHVARKMDAVNQAVTDVIEALIGTPEARQAFTQQASETPDRAAADEQLRALTERLAAVEDEILEGRMPASTGARLSTRLTEQIEEARAATATVYTSRIVTDVMNADDPAVAWKALEIADKREFLRSTVNVTLDRVGKGRWHDRRDGITVTPVNTR